MDENVVPNSAIERDLKPEKQEDKDMARCRRKRITFIARDKKGKRKRISFIARVCR